MDAMINGAAAGVWDEIYENTNSIRRTPAALSPVAFENIPLSPIVLFRIHFPQKWFPPHLFCTWFVCFTLCALTTNYYWTREHTHAHTHYFFIFIFICKRRDDEDDDEGRREGADDNLTQQLNPLWRWIGGWCSRQTQLRALERFKQKTVKCGSFKMVLCRVSIEPRILMSVCVLGGSSIQIQPHFFSFVLAYT